MMVSTDMMHVLFEGHWCSDCGRPVVNPYKLLTVDKCLCASHVSSGRPAVSRYDEEHREYDGALSLIHI